MSLNRCERLDVAENSKLVEENTDVYYIQSLLEGEEKRRNHLAKERNFKICFFASYSFHN